MKQLILVIVISLSSILSFSQKKAVLNTNRFVDFAATASNSKGTTALSYVYNWKFGKTKKYEAGLGVRFTSGFGTKQDYITAPAKLSRTSTIPFIVVASGQNTANWDTLTVQRPFTNSLSITANFAYNFNSYWSAGVNIDVIGFSLGRKTAAIFKSNGITTTEPVAKPAPFNLLLTGDLDYGDLNSEYFIKYKLNKHFFFRGIYQFYFTEYKTTSLKQTAPDGTTNDRFRQKQNNFGAGVSYNF